MVIENERLQESECSGQEAAKHLIDDGLVKIRPHLRSLTFEKWDGGIQEPPPAPTRFLDVTL
jgi:hypothetical protein